MNRDVTDQLSVLHPSAQEPHGACAPNRLGEGWLVPRAVGPRLSGDLSLERSHPRTSPPKACRPEFSLARKATGSPEGTSGEPAIYGQRGRYDQYSGQPWCN